MDRVVNSSEGDRIDCCLYKAWNSCLITQPNLRTKGTLKLQESKKQRFETLTNDEYATLSTLLQERESDNTRKGRRHGCQDFRSYTNDKALSLNLCFKLLTMAALNMMCYSPENINIDLGCRLGQY